MPRPTPSQIAFAQHLRFQQTDCERLLWTKLRDRRLANLKFRRQFPCPPYIIDFYCPYLKLAIEIDGGQHYSPAAIKADQNRTAYLNHQGIHLIRFSNLDVLHTLDALLEETLIAARSVRHCSQKDAIPTTLA